MKPSGGNERGGSRAASKGSGPIVGEVDRLTALVHEMNNLLDGSLRYLLLARRGLESAGEQGAPADKVQRQLGVVTEALERMSTLAHAAMQGPSMPLGSTLLSGTRPVSLFEAVSHATDVVRPLAEEHGVEIDVRVSPDAAVKPAGGLYAVVLNGLKNAIESIARAGGTGRVEISVIPGGVVPRGVELTTARHEWFEIEIKDDGVGVSPTVARSVLSRRVTDHPSGSGIGLAVAKCVVDEMGGRIELADRPERARERRRGAVLRVVVPLATGSERLIG